MTRKAASQSSGELNREKNSIHNTDVTLRTNVKSSRQQSINQSSTSGIKPVPHVQQATDAENINNTHCTG